MRKSFLIAIMILLSCLSLRPAAAQHSIAREWNEILLEGIRNDYAWPVVHARNLFHVSAAMFDAYAVFDEHCHPYFLGRTVDGFTIPFEGFAYDPALRDSLREEALSYAVYRLMYHRYFSSPDFIETKQLMDELMEAKGYNLDLQATDFSNGSAAALGNYIAAQIIAFGLQDGSNELGEYESQYYAPVNEPLSLAVGGDNPLVDPNRWQPLSFGEAFIDQSGNVIEPGVVDFLGPEWGNVTPFALSDLDKTTYERDNKTYAVYVDPLAPPYLGDETTDSFSDPYQWGFAMVASWSGHLDPTDGFRMDISPGSSGNYSIDDMPIAYEDYDLFYDFTEGEDPSLGHISNPATNLPYEPNEVLRGDYTRVLAEFWADGPDSETPPGHWFTLLNYINDHPLIVKKFEGQGEVLSDLAWDIKSYFLLGGAMHDAAISAWSAKGYYDYIRPISAIRYMATMGQSTNPSEPRYHAQGLPLIDGKIELVGVNDPLVGGNQENLGEIKVWSWRGHDVISNTETDEAGVGWILAKDWWPYQRPSFVTPPFAGYVSGHSTYSRAAAEVLTELTGSRFFPGGMGEFYAPKDEFLVFEDGPSEDVVLQWATYYDAADQCSLSRIWGGIHPPQDDLNGRRMGAYIGKKAFEFGSKYFNQSLLALPEVVPVSLYPNPTTTELNIELPNTVEVSNYQVLDLMGKKWSSGELIPSTNRTYRLEINLAPGLYYLQLDLAGKRQSIRFAVTED